MEQINKKSKVVCSAIIPSVRVPINTSVMDWSKEFDAVALNIQKDNPYYMAFQEVSILNDSKSYSIYVTDNICPTKDERLSFVQRMMKNSNFAKGDRIKFILYVKGTNIPFGVVVEDY